MNFKRFILFCALCCFLVMTGGAEPYVSNPNHGVTQTKETVVYITRTGTKYHRDGCQYLRQSKIKTTKKEAIHKGLGACKVCKP